MLFELAFCSEAMTNFPFLILTRNAYIYAYMCMYMYILVRVCMRMCMLHLASSSAALCCPRPPPKKSLLMAFGLWFVVCGPWFVI